jgi:DNA-binding MarR family transcriptional regulator
MRESDFPSGDVVDNPGFHVNLVARLLTRFFDHRLATLAVNVAYLPVLGALRVSAPRSQGELAQLAQIGQPAMAQMLMRMGKEGLVERTTDLNDGRKVQFALSANAMRRMASVRTALADGNREVFDALTEEELAAFIGSMHKLEKRLKALVGAQQDA